MTTLFPSTLLYAGIIATSTLFFYLLDTLLVRKKIEAKLFSKMLNRKELRK